MSSSAPPSCATQRRENLHHRLSGGEKRTGRIRIRIWRGFRAPYRSFRSDLLQSSGALQSGRRPCTEPAAGGSIEAPVRLSLPEAIAAGSCLSCWCRRKRRSSLRSTATKQAYDRELRPRLMVKAIQELQDCRRRAGSLESRGPRSARGLREDRGSGAIRRPRAGKLHHSRSRRG